MYIYIYDDMELLNSSGWFMPQLLDLWLLQPKQQSMSPRFTKKLEEPLHLEVHVLRSQARLSDMLCFYVFIASLWFLRISTHFF